MKLIALLLCGWTLSCAAPLATPAWEAPGVVIEVATFQLKPGVTPEAFQPLDLAVEQQHVSRQPGFLARQSAATEEGDWLVIVHWRSMADADASMASFADAPATAEFMGHLDPSTMSMKRYVKR